MNWLIAIALTFGLLPALLGSCKPSGGGGGSGDTSDSDDEADDGADDGSGSDDDSGSDDGSDDSADDETDDAAGTLALNPLADAAPRGLGADALQPTVTTPIAAADYAGPASAGTVALPALQLSTPPLGDGGHVDNPTPLADLLVEQDALLAGTADHCVDGWVLAPAVVNPPSGNTCFFDGAIRSGSGMENEPVGEACVVITARREANRAQVLLEAATRLQLAMLCQVKKSGRDVALPAVGASLDLQAEMLAAATEANADATVSLASISRLPDDGDQAVYRTDVRVRTHSVDGGGNDLGYSFKEVHLVHSPSTDGTGAYHGVIWMTQGPEAVGDDAPNAPLWLGVSYARIGTVEAPRLQFEVRRFAWKVATSPVQASGLLDLSAGAEQDSTAMDYGNFPNVDMNDHNWHNAVIDNIRYLNFDINPLDGEGSVAYFENDGAFSTAARGVVTSFVRGDDGKFSGCGVAGTAPSELSVRKALLEGTALT